MIEEEKSLSDTIDEIEEFERSEAVFKRLKEKTRALEDKIKADRLSVPPVVESHFNICTKEYIPPFIFKSILTYPLYYLFHFPAMVALIRFKHSMVNRWRYATGINRFIRKLRLNLFRNYIARFLWNLLVFYLILNILTYVVGYIDHLKSSTLFDNFLLAFNTYLTGYLNPANLRPWERFVLLILGAILIPGLRRNILNFLRAIGKTVYGVVAKDFFWRFNKSVSDANMVAYKFMSDQFFVQRKNYPAQTKFIIHTNDLHFIGAGRSKVSYYDQLKEVEKIHQRAGESSCPFLFVDPRRVVDDPEFLRFRIDAGQLVLDECIVRDYLVDKKFSGIKINPAQGYFPFDKSLLLLWLYLSERGIPVMTHCNRSFFFYRGRKKKQWDHHQVFKEPSGDGLTPLLMDKWNGLDFAMDFAHPLNYLCLLDSDKLCQLIGQLNDPFLNQAFGYKDPKRPLLKDLRNLKICIGSFGGEDQWDLFLKGNDLSRRLLRNGQGIDFFRNRKSEYSPSKESFIWKNADWYSIIFSMMLHHEHVYASLNLEQRGSHFSLLLKQILQNDLLKKKILWTANEFELSSNVKSAIPSLELTMHRWNLSKEEFDLIARHNPRIFLSTQYNNKALSDQY